MFNHIEVNLPKLERENIDGVRYYKVPDEEELLRLVSITSVTSHKNRQFLQTGVKKVVKKKQTRLLGRQLVGELICILWLSIF